VIAGVVAKNLTIGANACQDITVDADFSGAQQIALAIQSANGADLSATRIVTYFGVPGADWMAVGGEIKASDFPFYNGGGGMVPVFGPALLLQVCNDGASAVAFSQMTYYAVE
jgi:hypothetical protein